MSISLLTSRDDKKFRELFKGELNEYQLSQLLADNASVTIWLNIRATELPVAPSVKYLLNVLPL